MVPTHNLVLIHQTLASTVVGSIGLSCDKIFAVPSSNILNHNPENNESLQNQYLVQEVSKKLKKSNV